MLFNRFNMTEKDKNRFVEVNGKILLGLEMRDSICDIAKNVDLNPEQVYHNIDEMLFIIRKRVGWKRYITMLFVK